MIPGQTPGCEATLELSGPETRLLASMIRASEPVEPLAYCELEAEHAGLHYALGQISDQDWWWLRWDDSVQRRELVEAAPCDALAAPDGLGEQGVPCALPTGHDGAHGFTRPS